MDSVSYSEVSTIFNSEFDFVTPEAFMTQSMTANK